MRASACCTLMSLRGVTVAVVPLVKGLGWLTSWRSVIVTDSEPWATAAAVTCTCELMTTVPVRELMMTRAGASPGFDLDGFQRGEVADALIRIAGRDDLDGYRVGGLGRAGTQYLVDARRPRGPRW